MRRQYSWLIALVVSVAAPASGRDCPVHLKSESGLKTVEQQWVKALETRDLKQLECIFGPQFTDIGTNGLLRNRQEVIASIANRPHYRDKVDDLHVLIMGDTAVVRGINHVSDGSGRPVASVRFTDVFNYVDGMWKAVSAQETLVKEEKNE